MVGVDYGGDRLIRHFIDYYHDLGVPYDRFIFVLHHNPAFPDDETSSASLQPLAAQNAGGCLGSCQALRGSSTSKGTMIKNECGDGTHLSVQATRALLHSCAGTTLRSGAPAAATTLTQDLSTPCR